MADESFSSFYVELWVIGDEMKAMSEDSKNDRAIEMKVVNQFLHGLHDRLMKIDVKKYLLGNDFQKRDSTVTFENTKDQRFSTTG